jgi:hypothetical protein
MVDTTSIIISVLSLAGAIAAAIFSAYLTYAADERKARKETTALVRKYSDPLLVTAHDLQERFWELLDTRTTYFERKKGNGDENLRLFTCFLLGQFLAWNYILKTKTQFLAFSEDKQHSGLRTLLYKISDELSTLRYGENGKTFRLWPGHQLGIAENMIYHDKATEELRPMGWDQFRLDWDKKFKPYCGWFEESVIIMLNAKYDRAEMIPDQRLRRLQHFLVDLIVLLDPTGQARSDRPLKKCLSAIECDCEPVIIDGRRSDCDGKQLRIDRANRVRSENRALNIEYEQAEQEAHEKRRMEAQEKRRAAEHTKQS